MTAMFVGQVWAAYRYLSGTVSRETPYEVVFGLELALRDWVADKPYVITTAFLAELSYHFEGVPPQFYRLTESELGVAFENRVVQIALPQLYKHQPLNNAVLYHELGHFVDQQFAISIMMELRHVGAGGSPTPSQVSHCAEYFSDLFAACYVGEAVANMVDAIAPGAPNSYTHPASAERRLVVEKFLAGGVHPVLSLANESLVALGLLPLRTRFVEPDVTLCYDDVRPYRLTVESEVHGVLPAAQKYLLRRIGCLDGAWAGFDEGRAIQVVNDLTEKSIRNWMVREAWRNGSSA
jgi:hypothetical protein